MKLFSSLFGKKKAPQIEFQEKVVESKWLDCVDMRPKEVIEQRKSEMLPRKQLTEIPRPEPKLFHNDSDHSEQSRDRR